MVSPQVAEGGARQWSPSALTPDRLAAVVCMSMVRTTLSCLGSRMAPRMALIASARGAPPSHAVPLVHGAARGPTFSLPARLLPACYSCPRRLGASFASPCDGLGYSCPRPPKAVFSSAGLQPPGGGAARVVLTTRLARAPGWTDVAEVRLRARGLALNRDTALGVKLFSVTPGFSFPTARRACTPWSSTPRGL